MNVNRSWAHHTCGCSGEALSFLKLADRLWNEGRSLFFKNNAELSEIIMEINDLRRVACAPDPPEQDRRRFYNRAFRR